MLQDGHDGSWSSKRVITLLAFVIVSVSYLADQFTIYKASETLFDSIIYLVIAGLGFTASEKFAKKGKSNE
jgi:hypothetical protein